MACMWCRNFYRPPNNSLYDDPEAYLHAPGKCLKDPVAVAKTGADICGAFAFEKLQQDYDELPQIASMWLDMRQWHNEKKELRAEIRRLKEANSKLRAKLKADT